MTLSSSNPKNKIPLIFSFFSGAGFLDLGFEKSNFEIAYVNEYHLPFLEAYKYSRSKMQIPPPRFGYFCGDVASCLNGEESLNIKKYVQEAKKLGYLIGFIGGPPCPDFSVGGKNRGCEGENGKLSRTYIDLIVKHKPDFFVFENVKGLYRTVKHRAFFDELKQLLSQADYALTEKLINSIEYGAPQDRDRIILFGVQKTINASKAISDAALATMFNWNSNIKHPREDAFDNQKWPFPGQSAPNELTLSELTVDYWFKKNSVETHPNAIHRFNARAGLAKFTTILEGDDSRKSFKRLHRYRYSPTVAYGNNEVHIHPTEPRRISAAEALSLQSLPIEFELPPTMTLTNMFKTIGNGVPYLAAKGIANTIFTFLQEVKK